MKNEIKFSYGIFSESLEEQANKQGFTLGKEADKFENIRKSINMCGFHVATESQVKQMFNKLQKKVLDSLKSIND